MPLVTIEGVLEQHPGLVENKSRVSVKNFTKLSTVGRYYSENVLLESIIPGYCACETLICMGSSIYSMCNNNIMLAWHVPT